jgi:RHS repeat-associated protein
LKTTYGYDSSGHVTSITPPGEEPWTLNYGTITGDPDTGRLLTVSRPTLTSPTTATATVVYRVPLTGPGAPYDLSPNRTGQVHRAVGATAIFPPTRVPADPPTSSDYAYATVSYVDTEGREVNTADPGGGITTTDYDTWGNVTRELTAANRARALDASNTDASSDEAALASRLSTINTYSSDGIDLLETYGPEHDVWVHAVGDVRRGRAHTVHAYDEGALPSGTRYHQVTTSVTGVRVVGETTDRDEVTSKTAFVTQAAWEKRTPTSSISDAGTGRLNLTSYTSYTADALVEKTTMPGGTSAQNDAHTVVTAYYTADTSSPDDACDSRAEWVNLVCSTALAAQPTGVSTSRPKIPTTYLTYDRYNQPRVKTEVTDGVVHRTTTTTYDGAGRIWRSSTTASTGTALNTVENVYDPTSGRVTETRTIDGSGNEIDDLVRVFDLLGRPTSYTDADGNTSTIAYDQHSRPAVTSDGKGTQTHGYDTPRGNLTQLVDSHAGTFAATHDLNGAITVVSYPNGVEARLTYNETGGAVALDYVKTSGCSGAACTWLSETVDEDVHGRWVVRRSTMSDQVHGYDGAGRLTSVEDSVPNGAARACTTRVYTLDANSNRTQLSAYDPDSGTGDCQTTTAPTATTSSTFDESNRATSTGYIYDALGRTTSVPATHAGGTTLAASYHVNDLARSLTQGTATKTWTLDVAQHRYRSWTDGTTTKTNHYDGDGDRPAWTQETATSWTRAIVGITGDLAAIHDSAGSGTTELQLANLHGDVIATANIGASSGPTATFDATEFGTPRGTPRRYGWLGARTRSADTLAGIVLMGVRLYNPVTGRFLQADPVMGGSDSAYDYVGHDPLNSRDLDGRVRNRDEKPTCGPFSCRIPSNGWDGSIRQRLINAGKKVMGGARTLVRCGANPVVCVDNVKFALSGLIAAGFTIGFIAATAVACGASVGLGCVVVATLTVPAAGAAGYSSWRLIKSAFDKKNYHHL